MEKAMIVILCFITACIVGCRNEKKEEQTVLEVVPVQNQRMPATGPTIQTGETTQSDTQWYVKQQVGGCFTQADSKQFTHYAIQNDVDAIDEMLRTGRVVAIGPGPCKMIEQGFIESLIEYDGMQLYVSTDDLTRR